MAFEILPFHSALDYLVSLSQAIGARRAALRSCAEPDGACPAAEEAAEMLAVHRERELLGLASTEPRERGPLALADRCGFHILEVRILAYLFLSEGTAPRVPVYLDVEEMSRLAAQGPEAAQMPEFLDPDEALVAGGLVTRIQLGRRGMVALTDAGREAFVSGRLPVAGDQVERGAPEADEAPVWAPRVRPMKFLP
jgi:hypothetical protein